MAFFFPIQKGTRDKMHTSVPVQHGRTECFDGRLAVESLAGICEHVCDDAPDRMAT
jgi:hypothetical protein